MYYILNLMQNTFISIGIGALMVAGIGTLVYTQKNASMTPPVVSNENGEEPSETTTPTPTTPTETPNTGTGTPKPTTPSGGTTTTAPAPSGITAAEVAKHNSSASCWSTINGNVYDLTSWIPNHPGGQQAILQLCGTNGSAKFNGQHGGATLQLKTLAGFKIGVAAQ